MATQEDPLVPRRATAALAEGRSEPALLSAWRDATAYVLLAAPGAGKTTAMQAEAASTPGGIYRTARSFVVADAGDFPPGSVVFLDGLDEMRAGSAGRDTPLYQICEKLVRIGGPRFRLSCREADWIAAADTQVLSAAAPGSAMVELRLEPLSPEDIRTLLAHELSGAAVGVDALLEQALLENPLTLKLLAAASRRGALPKTRADTFRLACEWLAAEQNEIHRAARRDRAKAPGAYAPSIQDQLDDAGLLFAVLLLAGAEAISHAPQLTASDGDVSLESLPPELGLRGAEDVLASRLFVADGDRRLPLHRTVAEYLGAAAIARRVAGGLPIRRVLALMSGADGGIVEPLRGLHAWLAVHGLADRRTLIDGDPLGVVLYGDVASFAPTDKQSVLNALEREAHKFRWFRSGQWEAHPFGALGRRDMIPAFTTLLQRADRTPGHQALLGCVLDAVQHGLDLGEMLSTLEQVFRDGSFQDDVRQGALQGWLAHAGLDRPRARAWLDDILRGVITDPRDELCGLLLRALYPDVVAPHEVMQYFHLPNARSFIGSYRLFWAGELLRKTPAHHLPSLADGFADLRVDRSNSDVHHEVRSLFGAVTSAALAVAGEREDPRRVLSWLRTGLDKDGFAAIDGEDSEPVRIWLGSNPAVQKAVLGVVLQEVEPDPEAQRRKLWWSEQVLYGARRPADWYRWLLAQAGPTDSEELTQYCIEQAATAAVRMSVDFDITMEDVAKWVEQNKGRWPQAVEWLEKAWSSPLDHWQADQHRRKRAYLVKYNLDRDKRRSDLAPYAAEIRCGTAPAGVMYQLALAYRGRFSDLKGNTPEARLQEFLGGGPEDVAGALNGFEEVFYREDLPDVPQILERGFERREPLVRPACLTGAELAGGKDAGVSSRWTDALAGRLVAFWLTDGTGDTPSWYRHLAQSRPSVVAEVVVQFGKRLLREQPESSIPGLWLLTRDSEQRELAQLVLPHLLEALPARANEAQLRCLNHDLLPAAARHLERGLLDSLTASRLALNSLDAGQRIAWLVASLTREPETTVPKLLAFIGRSQARAMQLAVALSAQGQGQENLARLPPSALGVLIEKLAPHTRPEHPDGAYVERDTDRRRDLVRGLIGHLGTVPNEAAGQELRRLHDLPSMAAWAVLLEATTGNQIRVKRAAGFVHATGTAAAATLANKSPANSADLSALAVDRLRDLGNHIRHDGTDSLELFWRTDDEGRPTPKIENACRDALMALLRDKLLLRSVQVEREASAANLTRADLRVSAVASGRRVVVPIEIKKEDHRELWTAWRSQLDGSYVTDPAADGFGIYLVLWFGIKPRSASKGERPQSAAELENMLRCRIPEQDRARLSVVVFDLSRPIGKSKKEKDGTSRPSTPP
jgi:NTP pyrophosphatase (non-canonical NTP hydrolase)